MESESMSMSLAEVEASLPWGLHDAYLEGIEIDWLASTATLRVRVMMTRRQDQDQRAKITVNGLAFCAMDPPDPGRQNKGSAAAGGLWLNAGEGPANDAARERLPAVPDGCFLHWLFVNQWNSFIHISGREAHLEWLEPHPVAARSSSRALFPGEET
jgi:hypothetical protein